MESPETLSLTKPDGTCQMLNALPASREAAIDQIQRTWAGPGAYTFVREVSDPDGGEVRITEIVFSTYTGGEVGITVLATGCGITATVQDISRYLQDITGVAGDTPLQLSLDIYEDAPDCESNYAWLCLEDPSGTTVAEFGLAVRNRLSLPKRSESPTEPVYVCEFPTFRSAFRFIEIACETFRCDNVRFRSYPLNSGSDDWFS